MLYTNLLAAVAEIHPSTTQDVAAVVKIMKDGTELLEKDSKDLKTLTETIGDILTPVRLDTSGKSRMKAIQKLVNFQNGVISKLQCGTDDKVDAFLDELIRNEAELKVMQPTESTPLEKCGLTGGSLEDIQKHIEKMDSDLEAAGDTIEILRVHSKLLLEIKKGLDIERNVTADEIKVRFDHLKKSAEETRVELQADKLENMKSKTTEWRAAVDSLSTENVKLRANITNYTASLSGDASELDTIKQEKLTVETELAGAQTELSKCKTELSTCKDDLHKCEQDLTLIKPELERC
jgi:chromosome segregation ATPase